MTINKFAVLTNCKLKPSMMLYAGSEFVLTPENEADHTDRVLELVEAGAMQLIYQVEIDEVETESEVTSESETKIGTEGSGKETEVTTQGSATQASTSMESLKSARKERKDKTEKKD